MNWKSCSWNNKKLLAGVEHGTLRQEVHVLSADPASEAQNKENQAHIILIPSCQYSASLFQRRIYGRILGRIFDQLNKLPGSNCTWKSDRFCHRWITLGVSVTNQVDSTIFSTIIWPFNQHLQKEFCNFTETEVLASKIWQHMVKPLMPQWAEIILEVAFSFFSVLEQI